MARIGAARVIPAHNPKATKPEDAYKLNNMFPHSLMSALNVGQIMHAAEKAEDMQVGIAFVLTSHHRCLHITVCVMFV